jgi:hypothetical protein
MTAPDRRTIRTLDELPRDLPPARDLWPGIAAAIATLPQEAMPERLPSGRLPPAHPATPVATPSPLPLRGPSRRPAAWTAALALAATVACVAVGIWIGRASAPAAPAVAATAFAPDAHFGAERQALMVQAGLGLSRLPEEDRRKVEASLATIRGAIADIRRALGDDPGNRLLQEMLVNSYQDEIRVLTAAQEAGAAGQEI